MSYHLELHTPSAAVFSAMVIVSCAACAPVRLPGGPGERAVEAVIETYWEAVDRYCSFFSVDYSAVVTARVSVRGRSYGRRVLGRVWIGADHVNGSLRIESDAVPPHFVLTVDRANLISGPANNRDATLYLPRRQLVVRRESSRALLQAVLGLPLTVQEFVSAFTGCPDVDGAVAERTHGPNVMRLATEDLLTKNVFLHRKNRNSPWTLLAMTRYVPGRQFQWRAEYDRPAGVVYRTVRIVSDDESGNRRPPFDVKLALNDIRVAPLVNEGTFSPQVPPSVRIVSFETLQRQRSQPLVPLLNDD